MTDPQFIDPANGDFRLRATSPAIDAGIDLPEVLKDLVGVRRPQGPAYDTGAYESSSTDALAQSGKVDLENLVSFRPAAR